MLGFGMERTFERRLVRFSSAVRQAVQRTRREFTATRRPGQIGRIEVLRSFLTLEPFPGNLSS